MENETKYKFVETTGCTAFDFVVNDTSLSVLSKEEINEILDYLFVKIKEGINNNTILFPDVVKLFQPDDWHYGTETCETCGDSIDDMTWNI